MTTCERAPADKKTFGREVGRDLVGRFGAKPAYTVGEIKTVLVQRRTPIDWECWAYALYATAEAFAEHHAQRGEVCDYAAMKAEMVSAMTDGASASWFSVDLSWLDWPDLGSWFDVTP